jgi:hypothetical protein
MKISNVDPSFDGRIGKHLVILIQHFVALFAFIRVSTTKNQNSRPFFFCVDFDLHASFYANMTMIFASCG